MLLGFALVFSPQVLVGNVHWGVAPTWGNLAIAIPVAMLAYTGVETVSNLAEEAREPERSVPNAYKLVALAVFAIYFTLPLIALSALPVKEIDGETDDPPRAAARAGRLCERPCPRRRRQPRSRRGPPGLDPGLRRDPRRDDPLHRNERRDHRRLADHVLDGDVPADAGGLPEAPSAVQDAVSLAGAVRGGRADRDPAARATSKFVGTLVLAGGDPLVHRRARVDGALEPGPTRR